MSTHYNVRAYGAVGDGRTNDAAAIQAAIDACTAGGGGTVLIPAGAVYLSGSLVLKSHVELHVERGATLKASGDWADITQRLASGALTSGVVDPGAAQSGIFLAAYGAVDIGISGHGIIDGSGTEYVREATEHIYRMPLERPFTVFFIGCEQISLQDTEYRDGALWTVRLTGCTDVAIQGIRIDSDMRIPNTDGIDIDHCRGVRISDCSIRCPDDAICLKASDEFARYGACENVTVTNCVLETRSSALVLGVDATAPIRNVIFSNCIITNSNRGLSLNLGQPSVYENILFANIVIETRYFDEAWWGSGEPIYISTLPWQEETGTVRNIRFSNIVAHSENGVYVIGHEPGAVSGIVFDNVHVKLDKWTQFTGGRMDLRPWSGGPELVTHPTSGFYFDNADDVLIRDSEVTWGENIPEYFGEALVERSSRGLRLQGFRGEAAPHRSARVGS